MAALRSVAEIEAACLTAWPAIKTVLDGRWLWRFANGHTKRANSVQCLDAADDGDAELRLMRMASLSRRNNIPPIFRVTPLAGPGVIAALDAAGWEPFEETRVLALPLDGRPFDAAQPSRLFEPTDPDWYRTRGAMGGHSRAAMETSLAILGLIAVEAKGIVVYASDGCPAAVALAVNTGAIGVSVDVVTETSRRGNGHGRAVMQAALNWTQAGGARVAAIQVVANNTPAGRLYESLGFAEQYRYHYRRPVPAGRPP